MKTLEKELGFVVLVLALAACFAIAVHQGYEDGKTAGFDIHQMEASR